MSDKLRFKKTKFYKFDDRNRTFNLIEGYSVIGAEDLDWIGIIVHRNIHNQDYWDVSERKSGYGLPSYGHDRTRSITAEHCVKAVREAAEEKGKNLILNAISRSIIDLYQYR